jgi:hypothetical protein
MYAEVNVKTMGKLLLCFLSHAEPCRFNWEVTIETLNAVREVCSDQTKEFFRIARRRHIAMALGFLEPGGLLLELKMIYPDITEPEINDVKEWIELGSPEE